MKGRDRDVRKREPCRTRRRVCWYGNCYQGASPSSIATSTPRMPPLVLYSFGSFYCFVVFSVNVTILFGAIGTHAPKLFQTPNSSSKLSRAYNSSTPSSVSGRSPSRW
jgi:hypothetical protein